MCMVYNRPIQCLVSHISGAKIFFLRIFCYAQYVYIEHKTAILHGLLCITSKNLTVKW